MADSAATAPIFRPVSRSKLTISPEDRKVEIASILDASRAKNANRDITGALLVRQDYVVQTLEGEESVVRSVYEKISTDPRHEAVTLLEAQAVENGLSHGHTVSGDRGGDRRDAGRAGRP